MNEKVEPNCFENCTVGTDTFKIFFSTQICLVLDLVRARVQEISLLFNAEIWGGEYDLAGLGCEQQPE